MKQEDIVEALREHGGLTSNELYEIFFPNDQRADHCKISRITQMLRTLEKYGIVERMLNAGVYHAGSSKVLWRLAE